VQLGELQTNLESFAKLNADVWAIGSDTPETLARYASYRGITFPLLADPDLVVTKRYGVLNEQRPDFAYPTAFVIDSDGVVGFRRIDVDFRHRPPVDELLAALRALPVKKAPSHRGH
jgi:peroxiredoxin